MSGKGVDPDPDSQRGREDTRSRGLSARRRLQSHRYATFVVEDEH